jgi:hypothetical protein
LLATVVAKSRQATVIATGKQDRSPTFPCAVRRIGQLARSLSEDRLSRSTANNFHRVFRYSTVSVLNLR